MNTLDPSSLFKPFSQKSLHLKNRFVMAPMTRSQSPHGIPARAMTTYYAKRAHGDVGLILSESTGIDRPASLNDQAMPHFYGKQALAEWHNIIDAVHGSGGAMGPQLIHMGVSDNHYTGWTPGVPFEGPSNLNRPGFANGQAMSESAIADTIAAFGRAGLAARDIGFNCVEIHGAHGFLLDQFFWSETNNRSDIYGGKTLKERSRFAVEVVKEVRRQTGNDFAILMRLSQWKPSDYDYKLALTPDEMEDWLIPMADAGVDIFHCSQRRFWEPEFEGSPLNFAGWAKKITGQPTITVGSVGLTGEFLGAFAGESSSPSSLDKLIDCMERNEFDLVAVGRPLLADPDWVKKIREGRYNELKDFTKAAMDKLL